jgi:acetyl esterase/lipase
MSPSPAFDKPPTVDFADMAEQERINLGLHSFDDLEIENFFIEGSARDIPVRAYRSKTLEAPSRIMLWFHGGAFVFGGLDMPEGHVVSGELAGQTPALVYSVDYKLVDDDTRFPCAQIDALDVLNWAVAKATELGLGAEQIYIGGASAGACLAGSLALMARDRDISLGGVIPVYPVAHKLLPPFSDELKSLLEGIFYFDEEFAVKHNPWLVEGLSAAELANWHCFPGDTTDKSGQPKMLVLQAQRDSLRSSGDLWVQQLREAGNSVEEFTYTGAEHGFLNRSPKRDADMAGALSQMAEFIRS